MSDLRQVLFWPTAAILFLAACPSLSAAHPLAGFSHLIVEKPRYADGTVDRYGLGRYLEAKFRQDPSWEVVERNSPALAEINVGALLIVRMSHSFDQTFYNSLTLDFYDVAGELVWSISTRATSMGTRKTDIQNAIKKALTEIRTGRRRFDPAQARESDIQQYEMPREDLIRYLDENQSFLSPVEGIWTEVEQGSYTIGIVRNGAERPAEYVGFVLETSHRFWRTGMVKIQLTETARTGEYSCRYWMGSHQPTGTICSEDEGLLTLSVPVGGEKESVRFVKNYPAAKGGGDEAAAPVKVAGSGFAVGANLVVTNSHVVAGSSALSFVVGGEAFPAEVVVEDAANDLALLRLLPTKTGRYPGLQALRFGDAAEVRPGDDVYTVGYPLAGLLGKDPKVAEGIVSSSTGLRGDPRILQITVPVQPGNSGSPLLNSKGEVVGVVVASLNASALFREFDVLPQNVNFAIKSEYLLPMVRRHLSAQAQTVGDLPTPRADQVAQLQGSIGQVVAGGEEKH